MAIHPERMVTIPLGPQDARASVTMTLGAALYLGFKKEEIVPNVVQINLPAKTYKRAAWMGGPTIPVSRPQGTAIRHIGSSGSRAKTNKKLILEADGTQETVYFTGKQAEVVSFLLQHANGASFVIRNRHGRDLMPVLPADATP
jgi:hypothetical protein